ncbi:MAG TPA: universal stress protein [Terriglobales bacterium]|nr:universal stress protein [Terriglobales bacterium]
MELLEQKTSSSVAIKNVLFATDFSAASSAALPYAIAICQHYESMLHAEHVMFPQALFVAPEVTDPQVIDSMYESARLRAEKEMKRLGSHLSGVPHRLHLGIGDVWEVLAETARANNIDLVVVGTHGRTGVEKIVMGSIAEDIFRHARCPVLTVGPKISGRSKSRVICGTGGDCSPIDIEFRQIVFATDFSPHSLAAAPYAVSLAQEFGARLTLLHVLDYKVAGPRPAVIERTVNRLTDLVSEEAGLWCTPIPMVKFGAAADCILETAADRGADLIVMGVRPATGLNGAGTHLPWAIAHRVVSLANCPVLTIRG